MATVRRIGFGTIFELEDSKVGIGTDAATHTLQALGNIRSEGVQDVGVSTLTTYQGFTDKEARFGQVTTDKSQQLGTLSGEIVIDGDVTVSSATTFTSGPQHLTVTDTFTLPSGDTNSRALKPTAGSLRFNQDFATLEFYTGNNWAMVNTFTEMQNSPSSRGRAIFFGGYHTPGYTSEQNGLKIEFFEMSSGGHAHDFGNYGSRRTNTSGCSDGVRGLSASSYNGPGTIGSSNEIEYVTIASEGDAIDFGDRTQNGYGGQAVSSSTRGVFLANREPSNNVIDYVEIGTLGNALDFGDLISNGGYAAGNLNSPTRGFVAGGTPSKIADIQMITIASKGNAIKTGDLPRGTDNSTGASNSIRGIVSGGEAPTSPNSVNAFIADLFVMNLVSEGNAVNFGDLTTGRMRCGGAANQTRAIFAGGFTPQPSFVEKSTIDTVIFSSEGNAISFGDLGRPKHQFGATSDSHGGLGGF